ncbi:hypothetical protein QQ045_012013 [Rhodiola kirilowii]
MSYFAEHNAMMEKRQLFLRSYQFTRKKSVAERVKGFSIKVIRFPLKSAKKVRKIIRSALGDRRCSRFNNDASCFGDARMRRKSYYS